MYSISKKHLMRKAILNIIRSTEPVSRTDIKKLLDFRMASVIEIVNELIDEGIVIESGNLGIKGIKKKKLLYLNEDAFHTIGVDIQAEEIIAVLANLKGKILKRNVVHIKSDYSKDEILKVIFDLIEELTVSAIRRDKLLGIGISNPGILNKEKDHIIFSSQLEDWKDIPIKKLVEDKTGLPVFIDDSALLNLMAEKWFGKAGNYENIIYIQMGASFGVSIISDGGFVRGASGMAGEIGHTMVEPRGELCLCGNYGCLQTAASSGVIVRKVKTLLKKGASSLVSDIVNGDLDAIDIHAVIKAAESNDKISLAVLEEAARYIGVALSNTINLLNPEMVIFGGQMVKRTGYIIEPIKRIVKTSALQLASRDIIYETACFNEDGGVLGAVAMVLDEFFEYTRLKNMGMLPEETLNAI